MTDETKLANVIRSLYATAISAHESARELQNLYGTMNKIALKPDGSMPTDEDTNQPMTAARRDAIYDACIGQAYLALGLNEDGSRKE